MPCSHRTPAARLLVTGVLAGALAASTSHATPADAVEGARQVFVQAEADEDAERWSEAIDKLRAVGQVRLTAGVRYHIALCEEHLGQLVRALGDYRSAEDQARLENAKDVLRLVGKQLATLEARIPRLTIRVVPALPNASVKIDGEPIGDPISGAARPVDPGMHLVETTAPGRPGSTTTVTLREHESRALDMSLGEPVTGNPAPTTSAIGAQPLMGNSTSTSPPRSHAVAAVVTGVAIALAGGGTAAYFVAGAEDDHAPTTCASIVSTRANPCAWLKDQVRGWDWAAAGAWSGALAAGVVAAVLFTKQSTAPTRAGADFVVGPTALGVRGRF